MHLEDALTASSIHAALAQVAEDTFWLVSRMPHGEVLVEGHYSTQMLARVLEFPNGMPPAMYAPLGPLWQPFEGGPISAPSLPV